jgi:xylulokinase
MCENLDVISLDIGTSSIKGAIFNENGRKIYYITVGNAKISQPKYGFCEIDATEVYEKVCFVLKKLISKVRVNHAIISISSMCPVLILLDKDGKPILNAILYNDLRSLYEAQEINQKFGSKDLLKINGNIANIQQWGPKLLWLKKHKTKLYSKCARICDLSSFIVYNLTNEFVLDYTIAQETGFLDYHKKTWSNEIISFFGLDESMLPVLVETTKIVGEIKDKRIVAEQKDIKINAGCADSVASLLSIGQISQNELAMVIGSTGIVSYSTKYPKIDRRLYLDLSPINRLYYIMGATSASGLFLKFIMHILNLKGYSNLDHLASLSEPGANGLIILPYIYGERTPLFDPYARGVIFGLSARTTINDLLRASFESIAYSLFHNIIVFNELGYKIDYVKVTGGLIKSKLFLQMISDLTGKRLAVYQNSELLGNTFIAYKALGIIKKWSEVNQWLNESYTINPKHKNHQIYLTNFKAFLELYNRLKQFFKNYNLF